jgi:hypothetical protein
MTISAQNPQIASVCGPVFKSSAPRIAGLGFNFGCWVNMVDVESTNIVKSTYRTLPAKRAEQVNLSLPVLWMLVDRAAVLIPIRLLTFWRAIPDFTRLAAVLAGFISGPSVRQIAGLAAIFAGTVSQSIGVHFNLRSASDTSDRGSVRSHEMSLAHFSDMFISRPEPAKQEALF